MISALVAFMVTPALLSALGEERFGVWALGFSLLGYAALLDLGISASVSVGVMDAWRLGNSEEGRSLVRAGRLAYLRIGALLIALVVVFGRLALRGLNVPPALLGQAQWFLLAVAVAWVAQRWTAVTGTILETEQRFVRTQAVPTFVMGVTPVLALFTVSAGGGLPGAGLALAATATAACLIVWTRSGVRERRTRRAGSSVRVRTRLSGDVQAATAADIVNFSTDRVLVAAFINVSAVATYELGLRIAMLVLVLANVPQPILFPVLARWRGSGQIVSKAVRMGIYVTAGIGLLGAVTVVLIPSLVELWLGRRDTEVTWIATSLAIAFAVHASTGVYTAAMKAAERFRPARNFAVAIAVTNVLATLLLAPTYGLRGIVAGTFAALVGGSLVFFVWGLRRSGFGWTPLVCFGVCGVAAVSGVALARTSLGAEPSGFGGALALAGVTSAIYIVMVAVSAALANRRFARSAWLT